MDKRITAIVRKDPRAARDGCGARRAHFLDSIDPPPRVLILTTAPAAASRMEKLRAHAAAALALLVECCRPGGDLVLFYPELPFFFPASWPKLLPAALLLVLARLALAASGRRIVVDIVDIERWQAITLRSPRPRAARAMRAMEALLFRIASEIRVPGEELGQALARDLSISADRFRARPHLPPAVAAERTATLGGDLRVRYVYIGGLSPVEDRGIHQLIDAFRRVAPEWAELHLAGEHGDWITPRHRVAGLVYHGVLAEPELIDLVRRCHVGLVPYPEWGYYRTVLPAKLSFYAACGVTVVSTQLPEVERWIAAGGRGEILPFRELRSLFRRWPTSVPGETAAGS